MSWLGDALSAGENAIDAGEKLVGKAASAGADIVGDGLRDVGLDGAADAVEDLGDAVADHLGATVPERSLDETDDPTELVHGDPGALRDRAGKLASLSASLEEGGNGLRGISVGDWTGEAADGYHDKVNNEFPKWFVAADACHDAGTALTSLADTVEWAQRQAAEAASLWAQAKHLHDEWSRSGGDAPDPGEAVKSRAEDILKSARQQRDSVAHSTASALSSAADAAPPMPTADVRLVENMHDQAAEKAIEYGHAVAGALDSVTGTVKFIRTIQATDPYNMSHPAKYLSNVAAVGAGVVDVAAHPEKLITGLAGEDPGSDPAKATGEVIGNLAQMAIPGPKGVGALGSGAKAGESAAKAGAEAAETGGKSALEAGGAAATTGTRAAESGAGSTARGPGAAAKPTEPKPAGAAAPATKGSADAEKQIADGAAGEAKGPTHSPDSGSSVSTERPDGPSPAATHHESPVESQSLHGSTDTSRAPVQEPASGSHAPQPESMKPDHPAVNDHPVDSSPTKSTEPPDVSGAGEPVDVATGEYYLPVVDVDLPGVLPLRLGRTHRSAFQDGQWFGPSWSSTFDARAVTDADGVTTVDPDGVVLRFPLVTPGEKVESTTGRLWTLERSHLGGYALRDQHGNRCYWFDPKPQLNGADSAVGAFSISAVTDRYNNRILFGYTDMGVPSSVEHSGGYRILVDTADSRIIRYRAVILTPDGVDAHVLREFAYADGNLAAVTNSDGATTTFTYDGSHRIVEWLDSVGQRYANVYDDMGRVTSQSGPGGVWAGTFDYRELTDGTGRVTSYTDAVGATTYYALDVDGRPQRVIDPMGRTTVRKWDVRRNPLSITDPAGAETHFAYTPTGDLARITDSAGNVTEIRYAQPGLPSVVIRPDRTSERFVYDEHRNPVTAVDPAGFTRAMSYSSNGALRSVVDPEGRETLIEVNAAGLAVMVTDPLGRVTAYERDEFGRIIATVTADGRRSCRSYDLEGRVLSETAPDGSVQTWTYDGEGNRVSHINPVGAETRWEFGYFNLPIARIDADGSRTEFEYDLARRLIGVVNALGQRWDYEYFPDGQLARQSDFAGTETTYGYDRAGRLAWKTNGAGQRIDFVYDSLGRNVAESSSDERVEYTYDQLGQTVSARNSAGRLAFEYSASGHVVSESWNDAAVLSDWSPSGNLLLRTTPGGVAARDSYDHSGRLIELACGADRFEFSRDISGRTQRRSWGATAIDFTWDAADRMVRQSLTSHTPALAPQDASCAPGAPSSATSTFGYRGDGTLNYVAATGDTVLIPDSAVSVDVVGRVTSRRAGDSSETFTYDAGQNISSASGDNWSYDRGLLSDDGKTSYGYDGAGRVVRATRRRLSRKPDMWQYGWDAWDRLRWMVDPSGIRWEYDYDALGRRVSKSSSDGSRTRFVWSGTQLVEQVDETSGEVLSWIFEPGEIVPIGQIHGTETPPADSTSFLNLSTDSALPIGACHRVTSIDSSLRSSPTRSACPSRWSTPLTALSPGKLRYRCGDARHGPVKPHHCAFPDSTRTPNPGCSTTCSGTTTPTPDATSAPTHLVWPPHRTTTPTHRTRQSYAIRWGWIRVSTQASRLIMAQSLIRYINVSTRSTTINGRKERGRVAAAPLQISTARLATICYRRKLPMAGRFNIVNGT
ncbi:hypothetical protein GCM10027169_24370 [Gordonia jinhuaensis]|uniref:YD repeat-containing protein n=1 Tax=Gordonia jinhuaensis TaxID=1517702 RepID=A0A916WYP2_9ACTN|nr:hypothetical protein GCM10011489_29250 [Gordonia jinhuaensis]